MPWLSVTINWQSACRTSATRPSVPRVGFNPTIVAPASAAPPSQNTKSGTLSSRTPTWKGDARKCLSHSSRARHARAADSVTTSSQLQSRSRVRSPTWGSPTRSSSIEAMSVTVA